MFDFANWQKIERLVPYVMLSPPMSFVRHRGFYLFPLSLSHIAICSGAVSGPALTPV